MAIELNAHMLLLTEHTGRLINAVKDQLQLLAVRLSVVSPPADILVNCDDIILALLAFRT